jgi:hydrogenase maturation protease
MNLELAKQVADSVLYEGYLLYPYRASAVKNRQRFNFGVLLPPAYARAQTGNDAWCMQTECLLEGEEPRIDVRLRFLQVIVRQAGRLLYLHHDNPGSIEPQYELVPAITVDGDVFPTWLEAIEREVKVLDCRVTELAREGGGVEWNNPSTSETETLVNSTGHPAGVLVRRRERIDCTLKVKACRLRERLCKVTVEVANLSSCNGRCSREEALPHSLVAAHTILTAREGFFVSMLDPPESLKSESAACQNIGTWPVLLGTEGEREWMLSSPIILYDYPQIAAESAGSFFDGTEIDEMLALRVMTLTDDEKREMRTVDRLARELLERTESLPQEHLLKLHGTMRGLKPASS